MNADRLLELYDRIADAPDAVERLRRFVLDLAVRGKLVEQNPDDEPALVPQLRNEVVASNRLALAEAPTGWKVGKVGDLLEFRYGKGLKASERLDRGPVPVFGSNGIVGFTDTPLTEFPAIIVGRKGSAGALNVCEHPSWTTDVAYFIEPPNYFLLRFLFLSLFTLDLHRLGKGVKPGLSRSDAYEKLLSVPPLPEQHRIVAKVDELMALCDRLEETRSKRETTRDRFTAASLTRLIASVADEKTFRSHSRFALDALPALTTRPDQIKALRQTILDLAVRGKLVGQDPRDEPITELLKYLAADKARRTLAVRRNHTIEPHPLTSELHPYRIPASWMWIPLGDVTISRDGERIPVSRVERQSRKKIYHYYGASGVIDKIDDYLFDKPLLLIGEDGANLLNRSTPIAFIARGKYWVNNHAHVLDGLSEGFLRYLELFINATDLRPYVTGTAQPKMNQARLRSIPLALPPLPEQERIVAKVDELMALCDRLEASLKQADDKRARLLESLLAEALAPADRNQEAA